MSDPTLRPGHDATLRADNLRLVGKLVVVAALMFAFGYALVPVYRAICRCPSGWCRATRRATR